MKLEKFSSNNKEYQFLSSNVFANENGIDYINMPFSIKILFENAIRNSKYNNSEDIIKIFKSNYKKEISYLPTWVLMQDFTGVPAIVDLAAMRDAAKLRGINVADIDPMVQVDLVVDHSIQVDSYGQKNSSTINMDHEFERNHERYSLLKWGQQAFKNLRVVPSGVGICHQVNIEYLSSIVQVVQNKENPNSFSLMPDTLVGTDSHTTMVNGIGVLAWGVGGIEAESVMLGQPIAMNLPEVIGVKLTGKLKEGVTATDLVLTITHILRKKGVVNKFVEYFGEGVNKLSAFDRVTIANMAPEYGATCGFFPVDDKTLEYLQVTGHDIEHLEIIKKYCQLQGLWYDPDTNNATIDYHDVVELDLASIVPSVAGPKRPQDKLSLSELQGSIYENWPHVKDNIKLDKLTHGSVVLAAITSCTNTSNPSVVIAAGLVAKKAIEKGMKTKDWVKTSLAPGSPVVTEYLKNSDLLPYLEKLGFYVVGYGCTTCIGNSGPLNSDIEDAITKNDLVVASVLSGNRNFEGRVHPKTKANYLASPPLVIIYALAGTTLINLDVDPVGYDKDNNPVYLKDLWPSQDEINKYINKYISANLFTEKYKDIFIGNSAWQKINAPHGEVYNWQDDSTYIRCPDFFKQEDQDLNIKKFDIVDAKILALFGDSITTDHISPAGNIALNSPAGQYLLSKGIKQKDFNSYGARRGNHEVMIRGTFANIRIKNLLLPGIEGGYTKGANGEKVSIYDAAEEYKYLDIPLVIFAGKEYGTGSSRDWAAKGTVLLGVKVVVAKSFERIHRSNLIGMGVMPMILQEDDYGIVSKLNGTERINISFPDIISPNCTADLVIKDGDNIYKAQLLCDIKTKEEVEYYRSGGILQYVLNNK